MDDQARDGREGARAHRKNPRLGQGEQLPGRRKIRPLARQPDQLLPKLSEVRKVEHHPGATLCRIAAFMEKLRQEGGTAARALEFTILTAARTEEIIQACPAGINERERLWTAPAEHMKLKREHLVPLRDRALQLLDGASESYLFPSPSHPDKHLSNMAMLWSSIARAMAM